MTEGTVKKEITAPETTMPPLREMTWYPADTANPFLHLLAAAFFGFLSATPVVGIVHGMGADNCGGAVVLFAAFFAVAIPQILSRFALPAGIEKSFPHGVATMLLIGQVLAAYLFFMNTALYGSTAFAAAVLIVIPVFGRLAMIWFLKCRNTWACFLVVLLVSCWIFSLFQPEVMDLPLFPFLQKVRWNNGAAGTGMAIWFLKNPLLFVLVATGICAWSFRKMTARKDAAMATAMIAELAAWTAFLIITQSLTFFPG